MTETRVEVRPLRPEDEPLLFGLARLDRGADRRTLDVLEGETVFVAEVDGAAAGYVAVELTEASARVDQLFVSPEHEREGVGRRLLEHAEGYAISQGAATLQVIVEDENRRAHDFYRGRGFVSVGENVLELVLPQA
jgi:ribosomal protein S18 acetylase RimI-like enzyme